MLTNPCSLNSKESESDEELQSETPFQKLFSLRFKPHLFVKLFLWKHRHSISFILNLILVSPKFNMT